MLQVVFFFLFNIPSLNGRENPNGGVVSHISRTDCYLMLIIGLKCILLVLQGIDTSLVQSIVSVLTIPALYFNDFNPPKLAEIQIGIT